MARVPGVAGTVVSSEPARLEAYVTAVAEAMGLPIPPASLPLVAENLQRLLAAGALVLERSLPDDLEPPAVFEP